MLLCAASLPLPTATGGETNRAAISYAAPPVALEPVGRSDIFLDRVFEELVASDRTVFDRFTGPSAELGWVQRQNTLGYASLERFNADGVAMFASIGLDSLRTTAVETLPLDSPMLLSTEAAMFSSFSSS